ncbi:MULTISPECIES: hypothetical protein [Streptococcus]|nr:MULTISPECIES: hypothetical protein [Streptococcus]MBF0776976.1 hypothetical protein [Streptococcus sp. 19428wD3_AN2]TFU81970.1 hypothetical protein E4T83_09500 [Streptococcus sp. AN2]
MLMRNFNTIEQKWLNLMLDVNFLGKDILKKQVSTAVIIDEEINFSNYSLILRTESSTPYPFGERVPLIMQAYQPSGIPIEFLLHVVNSFIAEFEVYNAAGDELDINQISLEDIKFEIRVQ